MAMGVIPVVTMNLLPIYCLTAVIHIILAEHCALEGVHSFTPGISNGFELGLRLPVSFWKGKEAFGLLGLIVEMWKQTF